MSITSGLATVKAWIKKGRPLILLTGLILSCFLFLLFLYEPIFIRVTDHKLYDSFLRSSLGKKASDVPIIVDLDDRSLAEYGQWPWPRYRVALLIEKIRRLGALSVGLDITFAEPDRTSPQKLQQDLMRDLKVEIEFKGLPPALMNNDEVLANVLANGPFVLGYSFTFDPGLKQEKECVLHPLNTALLMTPGVDANTRFYYTASGAICNLDIIGAAAHMSGFFSTAPDVDGVFRRTPLFMKYRNEFYPNLSLATLMTALNTEQAVLKVHPGGVEMRVADKIVPLDTRGALLVNYRGPQRTYKYYSAAAVLSDALPPDSFKGKVAFVGTSAAGLKDMRATPLDPAYPGVEVHAAVVDNILTGDIISRPNWGSRLELLLVPLIGIISTLLLTWSRPIHSLFLFGAFALALWKGTFWIFKTKGLFLSPLLPLLTLGIIFTILTLLKFWREETEKKFIHSAFAQYVSGAVVDQIAKSPEKLTLSGEDKEVSILFSDIRGFTSLSEKMSPQDVTEMLRAYFTPMTGVITETGGTLDKFIGDAIMAFWNAPLDVPDHQDCAVKAALGMLSELKILNKEIKERWDIEIKIGLGIHSGRVSVGNMGSQDLFDYTIIGDNVNLASRVEGLTKAYGLALLVTEPVKEACGADLVFQEVDCVRVKGKKEPVILYTAFEPEQGNGIKEELEFHRQALIHYKNREFEEAGGIFARLSDQKPEVKLYSLYHQRCRDLKKNPPGPSWDCVFTHTTK